MGNPVRLAIIGCGSVSHRYAPQIRALRERGSVVIAGACDVDERKRLAVERDLGDVSFTTRYEDLVERSDVDAVAVFTSMREHGEISAAALRSGKHVLVEKPMATTLDEAYRLLELARESSLLLVCAPHVVLSPTFQILWKRVVHLRELGDIHLARARYGWAGPWWGQWYYRPGGGALFDLGVYNLTSLTGLLGPVRRVVAMGGTAIPERVIDRVRTPVEVFDSGHVLLDFGKESYAVVTTGFTMQSSRGPSLELYGMEGTIQLLGYDWAPEGYERWQNTTATWETFADADPSWPWTAGITHLIDCLETGASPLNTPEHALHVLEVMLTAEESAKKGKALELETTFPSIRLNPDEIELLPDPYREERVGASTPWETEVETDRRAKRLRQAAPLQRQQDPRSRPQRESEDRP